MNLPTKRLSKKEKRVVKTLQNNLGITNEKIAAKLSMTELTVKSHIKNIFRKTGCKSRDELSVGIKRKKETSNNSNNRLTAREVEILKMISKGDSARSIASKLDLSKKTVESHRYNLMNKLDLHSSVALVHYALAHNLIHLQSTGTP